MNFITIQRYHNDLSSALKSCLKNDNPEVDNLKQIYILDYTIFKVKQ